MTKKQLLLIPFVAAFVLYANTIGHQYTLDDNAVITNHKHVKAGLGGLSKIFTTNMLNGFEGFNDGLYRPLPLATFAIEAELFDNNPAISHTVNILLYALLCSLLCLLLYKLFFKERPWLAVLIALLFAAHPIHTEAVANVKGRDELLSFLFLILATGQFFRYINTKKTGKLAIGLLYFLLALLSKESAITAIVAIPLALYFAHTKKWKPVVPAGIGLLVVGVGWLFWRQNVISSMPREVDEGVFGLLNNSFAGAEGFSEKLGSALWLQVLYLWKTVLPHPLSHDYSFNQIPVVELASAKAIAGLLLVGVLLFFAYKKWQRNSLITLGILWYFVTISPASNFLLLIGVTMAERLLFTPSFGFVLVLGLLLSGLVKTKNTQKPLSIMKKNTGFALLFGVIFVSYGFKTIVRNQAWKDNLTLFSHDVEIVQQSARAHYNAGTAAFEAAKMENNPTKKNELLNYAIPHLKTATDIYPEYKDAFNNLGSAYNLAEQPQNAIPVFQQLLQKDPTYARAYYNLGNAYEAAGMNTEAANMYGKYAENRPEAAVYYRQAVVYGKANQLDNAIAALNKALQLNPTFNEAYLNLGQAYGMKGDFNASIQAFQNFLKNQPNNPEALDGLGTTYLLSGQHQQAIEAFQKLLQIQPQNQAAQAKLNEARSKL